METVTSFDGTKLAYDRHPGGEAGVVILIGGALSNRTVTKMAGLAATLATVSGLTVINYDRCGRATPPVSTTCNVRSTTLSCWPRPPAESRCCSAGPPEACWRRRPAGSPDSGECSPSNRPSSATIHTTAARPGPALRELMAADRRSQAVRFYMTQVMGIPAAYVALTRISPIWPRLTATANSTPHDWTVVTEYMRGNPLPPSRLGRRDPSRPSSYAAARPSDAAEGGTGHRRCAAQRRTPRTTQTQPQPHIRLLAPTAAEFLTR
jgi:hypothetical protein